MNVPEEISCWGTWHHVSHSFNVLLNCRQASVTNAPILAGTQLVSHNRGWGVGVGVGGPKPHSLLCLPCLCCGELWFRALLTPPSGWRALGPRTGLWGGWRGGVCVCVFKGPLPCFQAPPLPPPPSLVSSSPSSPPLLPFPSVPSLCSPLSLHPAPPTALVTWGHRGI